MKNRLKKYLPSTKSLKNSSQLKGLRSFFHDSCFWSRDQERVSRGIAAGLAGSVIPGFQIFYAALLVIILRGNLPIALLFTLITNPLTAVPITYFIYFIGTTILSSEQTNFVVKRFQWDFSSWHAFWSNVGAWLFQFGKAYLIGLPVVSLSMGLIGYFGTQLIWYGVKLFTKKN